MNLVCFGLSYKTHCCVFVNIPTGYVPLFFFSQSVFEVLMENQQKEQPQPSRKRRRKNLAAEFFDTEALMDNDDNAVPDNDNRHDSTVNIQNERRDPEQLNFEFIRDHIHNFGNYGGGEVDILNCLSKSKTNSYRAFLLFFSIQNQNLCSKEDVTLMKEVFESKGESGFCKSTLDPCIINNSCNSMWNGNGDVDEDGVCIGNDGFGILYLRGSHKYDTLYKELNSASFRFKGMFALRAIKNAKLQRVTQIIKRWMPGQKPIFSFGAGDELECKDKTINIKQMIALAIKYNLNVDEFLHAYWHIGNNRALSPLKSNEVIDALDCEEHKSNAMRFNQHPRRKYLAENACLQARVERANRRRKEDTFDAIFLRLWGERQCFLIGERNVVQKPNAKGMYNILKYCAYQGISPVRFFEMLCAFFFFNKKGTNIFTLWGGNNSCGKSTLLSAIQILVGNDNQCQLRFNKHTNKFWGAPLKFAAVAFCDGIQDFRLICGKEHYFDGIMEQPIKCKGKATELIRVPPVMFTSNYKPLSKFLEERMMHLVIDRVLTPAHSYPWPHSTPSFEEDNVEMVDITPPTASDLQAFLIVGLLIRDMGYLLEEDPQVPGFPWKENLPLNNRCQHIISK